MSYQAPYDARIRTAEWMRTSSSATSKRNSARCTCTGPRPPGEGGEGQACRKGKERKMAKQVTSENQEDIDAMIRAADRGELIHHTEAAIRRDPGAPLLTDDQVASLMAQSMAKLDKLEKRRAEARTARHT